MAMLRHYFKTCTDFLAGSAFWIASALVISCFWLLTSFWLPSHPSVCVSYLIGLLRNYWTSAFNMKYFPNFWGMHDWDTWIIICGSFSRGDKYFKRQDTKLTSLTPVCGGSCIGWTSQDVFERQGTRTAPGIPTVQNARNHAAKVTKNLCGLKDENFLPWLKKS